MIGRSPLRKGKKTLNCLPDYRWPMEQNHQQCWGWVNPGVEVTYCECACHENNNPRKSYYEAKKRSFPNS